MVDWWTFFFWLSDFLFFLGGGKCWDGSLHDGSLLMNHFGSTKASLLLNMKFSFLWGVWLGGRDMASLANLSNIEDCLPSKISEPEAVKWPKLWGCPWSTLYWLTTWNHTNQLGPLFTFMDSTLTMFRQYPNPSMWNPTECLHVSSFCSEFIVIPNEITFHHSERATMTKFSSAVHVFPYVFFE